MGRRRRPVETVLRELVAQQDKLLMAYRLGDQRRGGAAVDKIIALRVELTSLDGATPPPPSTQTAGPKEES